MRRLFFFILLCVGLYAQDVKQALIGDFSGGLNTRVLPSRLPDTCTPSVNGWWFDQTFALESIPGPSLIGGYHVQYGCIGGYYYRTGSGVAYYVIHRGDTLLATEDGTTWTTITSGLSSRSPCVYATYDGVLIVSNGVDPVATWDGRTYTQLPFVPRGNSITVLNNSIWLANIIAEPNTIYFSEPGVPIADQSAWPARNAYVIDSRDGDYITAIIAFANKIYAYKRSKIYAIVPGGVQSHIVRIHDTVGCVAPYTLVHHNGGLVWLGRDGVYATDGVTVKLVSDPIQPSIQSITQLSGGGKRYRTIDNDDDFAAGILSNMFVGTNGIWVSTNTKTWDTFNTGTKYNVATHAGVITLSTSVATVEEPLPYTIKTIPSILPGVASVSKINDGDSTSFDLITQECQYYHDKYNYLMLNPDVVGWYVQSGNPQIQLSLSFPTCTLSRMTWIWQMVNGRPATPTHDASTASSAIEIQYRNPYTGQYVNISPWRPVSIQHFDSPTKRIELHRAWHPEERTWLQPPKSVTDRGLSELAWYAPIGGHYNYLWAADWWNATAYRMQDWDTTYNFGGVESDEVLLTFRVVPGWTNEQKYTMSLKINDISLYRRVAGQQYVASGMWISEPWSTGFDNPVYGKIYIDYSTYTGTAVQCWAQTSADTIVWSSSFPVTNGYDLSTSSMPRHRYFRVVTLLSTTDPSQTPVVRRVHVQCQAGSGSYTSEVFSVSPSVWDYYVVSQATTCTIMHYIRGSDAWFSPQSSTPTWSAIANNTLITLSTTTRYIQLRSAVTVTSGDPAWINSYAIAWWVGTPYTEAAGTSYNGRYWLAVGTSSTHNDTVYIYDTRGAWTAMSMPVIAWMVDHTGALVALARSTNLYRFDGAAPLFDEHQYWVSKQYDFGLPGYRKRLLKIVVSGTSSDDTKPIYLGWRGEYDADFSTTTITLSSSRIDTKTIRVGVDTPQRYYQFMVRKVFLAEPYNIKISYIQPYYTVVTDEDR